MKIYEVTTVRVNLNSLEQESVTTIRREDEMACFKKPRKLLKPIVDTFFTDDEDNTFFTSVVTRIK